MSPTAAHSGSKVRLAAPSRAAGRYASSLPAGLSPLSSLSDRDGTAGQRASVIAFVQTFWFSTRGGARLRSPSRRVYFILNSWENPKPPGSAAEQAVNEYFELSTEKSWRRLMAG